MLSAFNKSLKAAIKRSDLDEAERLLERLKEKDPSSVDTRGFELEILLARKRFDEASRLAEHLVKLFPKSGRVLFLAGQAAFFRRDYSRAVAMFEESRRVYPHWKSKQWLGKALTNMGRFDEAEALLKEALHKEPFCRMDLAWLYERKGLVDRALKELETHLERFPNDQRASAKRTELRARQKDQSEIIEQVAIIEELGEEIPQEIVPRYVESLIESGRGDEVRKFVREKSKRYSSKISIDMGWICYRHQVHDLAFELFLPNLEAHLGDFRFLSTIEKTACYAGRIDDLIEAYEDLAPKSNALYARSKKLDKRRQTTG